jgi:hypothetical protein
MFLSKRATGSRMAIQVHEKQLDHSIPAENAEKMNRKFIRAE